MDTGKKKEDKLAGGRTIQITRANQPIRKLELRPPLRTLSSIAANTSVDQSKKTSLVKTIELPNKGFTKTYIGNNKTAKALNKENISPCNKVLSKTYVGNNVNANVALKKEKSLPTTSKTGDHLGVSTPINTFGVRQIFSEDFRNETAACSGCSTLWEDGSDDLYTYDILKYLLQVENRVRKKILISHYLRANLVERFIRRSVEADLDGGYARMVQYACWYLDHYLSMVVCRPEDLYALGWACFWLASKLDGNERLSVMITKHARKFGFFNNVKRFERAVLIKLNFPTCPVIPLDFIAYLAKCCSKTTFDYIQEVAIFVSLSGLLWDKYINEEYPSVIAATSVVISLEYTEQQFLLNRLYLCPIFKMIMKKKPVTGIFERLKASCRHVLDAEETFCQKNIINVFSSPPHYILPRIRSKIFR